MPLCWAGFLNEPFLQDSRYFICTIATHSNKWIFSDDMKPYDVVVKSLDDIYSQNSTGWVFSVYVNRTDFTSL